MRFKVMDLYINFRNAVQVTMLMGTLPVALVNDCTNMAHSSNRYGTEGTNG
jgi:hypothetical protein